MSRFQCPYPDNLNPLSPNGFQLIIDRLPGVSFFTQDAPIPSIVLPESIQNTQFSDISVPGDKLNFEPLSITFLVDEKMENWKSIFNWMSGLGFPESNEQYSDYINSVKTGYSELQKFYSEARLIVYGNNLTPIQTLNFEDIYPTSLGQLSFTNVSNDVQYLTASATFNYTTYNFD